MTRRAEKFHPTVIWLTGHPNCGRNSSLGDCERGSAPINVIWSFPSVKRVKLNSNDAWQSAFGFQLEDIIKLKSHPSVCLSVTPLVRLGLLKSTYQLPNIINPSFSTLSLSPRVNAVISLHSAAAWRRRSGENLSNIPLKTTAIWLNG